MPIHPPASAPSMLEAQSRQPLESDPVRDDLLCVGVKIHRLADNHWADDRLGRGSMSAIHPLLQPSQKAPTVVVSQG
jgi:hypothetical protein